LTIQYCRSALDSGFAGPEAFSRAFKQRIGQTPSAFRKEPQWTFWQMALSPINHARSAQMKSKFIEVHVRIDDFPETPVAVLEHYGDPALIGDSIRRFIAWRKQAGLTPKDCATFNILHADPENIAPEDYRLDLCAATNRPIPPNDRGVISGVIPKGRCAALRVTGSSDDLRPAASFLYADWLPRSGEQIRDFPMFVQRLTFFPDVPECEALTEVFLPLTY
jgi:AraC family transcriptional regulator